MRSDLILRIVLQQPPIGVDYGLQRGHGSKWEIFQKQRSNGESLIFEFPVQLKITDNDPPDFGGPFVQGRKGERFIYIGIGRHAGQVNSFWSRRLKVPLTGLAALIAQSALLEPNELLTAYVPGTGSDGSPACATVKNFAGWKLGSKN